MFNYSELVKTGKFYIEFNTKNNNDINYSGSDVEDLIRYWYRSWFDKLTNPVIKWINYNVFSTNDVIEIQVNLADCKSIHYATKDFITATESINGDNRRSLHRVLSTGVSNAKTKLPKINCDFVINNTYSSKVNKVIKDIPNPYLVKDFSVKQLNSNVVNINNVLNDLSILIEQDKDVLDKILKEDNYLSKYSISRNQLDKLEQLELAVNALTKYLEL